MSGGFLADHDELATKSTAVAAVGSSIRECVTAAQSEGVGGLVYGVLFDPTMLPLLSMCNDTLSGMIGDLADAADAIAKNLKANADTYASVEQFLTQHFGSMTTGPGNG